MHNGCTNTHTHTHITLVENIHNINDESSIIIWTCLHRIQSGWRQFPQMCLLAFIKCFFFY